MATAPVKSQPLHNFSLPLLKWGGKNHTNSPNRCRRPISPAASEPDSDYQDSDPPPRVGSRSSRNRLAGFASCSLLQQKQQHWERGESNSEADEVKERKEEAEGEEAVQKPWKLRPRKAVQRVSVEIGEGQETVVQNQNQNQNQSQSENPQPKSLRLRGLESQSVEKKEKRKFWIALSRDEIEEDIFVITGSRPARRPRKRPKNVQKQLDNVFPGLWLVGTTADSYRVADAPAKR